MNIALILSGGTGRRMGMDIPKQYIEVCGRPIIAYVLERLFFCETIDAVQIVAEQDWHDLIGKSIDALASPCAMLRQKFRGFSEP